MTSVLPANGLWTSWIDDAPVLRRRALRLTKGDREEAEDLLSSTLIKAVSHVERAETHIREPRAFLLFALKNEYISRLRRKNSSVRCGISRLTSTRTTTRALPMCAPRRSICCGSRKSCGG
ncbi:sigma factor [Pannonibacter sp. Pt2-lr]